MLGAPFSLIFVALRGPQPRCYSRRGHLPLLLHATTTATYTAVPRDGTRALHAGLSGRVFFSSQRHLRRMQGPADRSYFNSSFVAWHPVFFVPPRHESGRIQYGALWIFEPRIGSRSVRRLRTKCPANLKLHTEPDPHRQRADTGVWHARIWSAHHSYLTNIGASRSCLVCSSTLSVRPSRVHRSWRKLLNGAWFCMMNMHVSPASPENRQKSYVPPSILKLGSDLGQWADCNPL